MKKHSPPPPGNFARSTSADLLKRCVAAMPDEKQERTLAGLTFDAAGELSQAHRDKLIAIALDLGVMPRPARAVRALSDVSPSLLDPAGNCEAEAVLGTRIVNGKIERFLPVPTRPDRRMA